MAGDRLSGLRKLGALVSRDTAHLRIRFSLPRGPPAHPGSHCCPLDGVVVVLLQQPLVSCFPKTGKMLPCWSTRRLTASLRAVELGGRAARGRRQLTGGTAPQPLLPPPKELEPKRAGPEAPLARATAAAGARLPPASLHLQRSLRLLERGGEGWGQEPQASSPFRTPTAGSLQSWDRRVRPRLV